MEIVLDLARAYARTFGASSGSLLFTGAPGLGKTMLASCIARNVSKRGFSVVYDTFPSIFLKYESEKFGRGDGDELSQSIRRYREADLLIADDLGSEMHTAFTSMVLYELTNSRLITGRKTIITTNLTVQEIYARFTPAIASRIAGEFHVVEFVGSDIRIMKKTV